MLLISNILPDTKIPIKPKNNTDKIFNLGERRGMKELILDGHSLKSNYKTLTSDSFIFMLNIAYLLGDRLMAGRQTLDLSIGVRIPVPQV